MTAQSEVKVKICGLKDVDTIEGMNGLPFHYLGLVFAPSRRQVTGKQAGKLVEAARKIKGAGGNRPLVVGVFVDASIAHIGEVLNDAPLDVVQLHGQESADYMCELRKAYPQLHIWKVCSVSKEEPMESDQILAVLSAYRTAIDALLIDAPGGGTGQTFNWERIEAYGLAARQLGIPLFVAGGLQADNVGKLLEKHSPDGIDVSSGVEIEGRKDLGKIALFIRRVMER
ncbi:phosphoribosylanthranilate isomerase [Paenibacillus sp. J5C_2022]|uniref:phosphoribosylanthranilate isomerase n=1 Tax=Paenibacillus sp. J5C2022 TaxID=2977129 RepID=UPI0021D2A54A|nr:phosphoribosylanthranilate isomerase [Paenibacillus sp. J5C2022]MCU6708347.1 phosphoribosylanthranilate isomerase [Paenibacillus sp. J5C2022]